MKLPVRGLLREPLLHFVLIGAALFGLHRLADPGSLDDSEQRIVVSAGRIEQLASVFARTWQRAPTPGELKGLIDEYVLEEVYYRAALRMGIDEDDTVIRRRLRQKVEFLIADTAALFEPTDEELGAYLSANEEEFRKDPAYTFRQIYFNPERHAETLVTAQLASLSANQAVRRDPTLIPESFASSSRHEVDGTFGTGFTSQLDELAPGVWSGPIRSGLGWHLVQLGSRTPGYLPELPVIRGAVAREWANAKRQETRRALNERLLEDYEVVIEWPEEAEG